MRPVRFINAAGGNGKTTVILDTSVLVDLVDNAPQARKAVFISHGFDQLLEVKRRLQEILSHLDRDAAIDKCASIVLLSDPDQLAAGNIERIAEPTGAVAISRTEFRAFILSLLHRTSSLVALVLSIVEKPYHPFTGFLIERRWFLLHGVHPPRPFLSAIAVCR